MTLCNMSIEGGARAGMVAPDERTIAYIKGRPLAPTGALFEQAVQAWQQLKTDANATYDMTVTMRAEDIAPQVSWGTSPGMVTGIDQRVPDPRTITDENQRQATARALEYMGLTPNMPMTNIAIDKDGKHLLEGETTVILSESEGKTTLTLQTHAIGLVPIAPQMLAGMEAGWNQSIDKLAELFLRSAAR